LSTVSGLENVFVRDIHLVAFVGYTWKIGVKAIQFFIFNHHRSLCPFEWTDIYKKVIEK